jgi:hypothetical protein
MSNVRLITCSGLCLLVTLCVTGSVRAYDYADDFATDKAMTDGYLHSTFWSRQGVPPSEPYLYYTDTNPGRALAFADSQGRMAQLGYRLPLTTSAWVARAVKGYFALDVSYRSEVAQLVPGRLEYQTSSDGVSWSTAQVLGEGYYQIPLTSATGVCYVLLTGTRAVIDNVQVYLSSQPVTIRVPQNFATIQAAIDAAGDGDVIELAAGTYRGPGNRDIDFQGKAITVRGAAGAANETILDCEGSAAGAAGAHRGFYFHRSEGPDSVVSDLTIRGGRVFGSQVPSNPLPSATDPIGGGIYCAYSSPTIANCIIEDCGAELGGGIGGVGAQPTITECVIEQCFAGKLDTAGSSGRGGAIGLFRNSNATITKCTIRANTGNDNNSLGAGLYFQQSAATVAGCTIAANTAESVKGGGAYCTGASTDATASVTFRNCIFSRNEALAGAGICVEGGASYPRCRVNVINCTVAQNALLRGAAVGAAGGIQSSGADLTVSSSILWGNGKALVITGSMLVDAVEYSDVEGGYSGPGNIKTDPAFANMSAEDYHLKSKSARYDPAAERWVSDSVDSPCIDMGDPDASVGEEPPPNGNRINMGAFGGTKQASQGPKHSVFHVNYSGGSDWNQGLTPERPFKTIQKAIDTAQPGDIVLVWPGTYNEQLDFKGKAITVRSADDAAVLTSLDYAVTFRTGGPGCVLANFVISGCPIAGILCSGASPTLRNLTIVGNGTGILAYEGSDPNITNCILWYNRDDDLGGGWCKARFSNIERNKADTAVGNIQREPMFADQTRGDYHLRSQWGRYVYLSDTWVTDRDTSPCIDTGNPRDDYRGEPTPNGDRINMGAYGGTPYASKSSY